MSVSKSKILKELKKRAAESERAAAVPAFDLEKYLFDKQYSFVNDKSQYKTAVCSRRSGKTESCAADLVFTCVDTPRVNCLYITLTRVSAKKIIWRTIKEIIKLFQIPTIKINEQALEIEFTNGSMLYVSGAKDASEIERFRGMSLKKVYIDECQSFRSYIKELVDDIIVPATWDVAGSVCLIGTPGPVPAGFFYDASHSSAWSNHKWTIFDNIFIEKKAGKTVAEILKAERDRKGITENDPTYMREALGQWVEDENALVFKFNKNINLYGSPPTGRMIYILGLDIGWHDADAIAVLGYNYQDGKVYLVEEDIKSKQTITDVIAKVKYYQDKYQPVKMVMDGGGLGKKIQEEIRQRHGINMEVAEKHRKFEFIELMNDDLRTGKMKVFKGSRFEQDCSLVTWDRSNPDKLAVSDIYHTDIGDAVLYAWRHCKHYIEAEGAVRSPNKNTQAYMDELEAKEAEAMELKKTQEADDVVTDDDLAFIFDNEGQSDDGW